MGCLYEKSKCEKKVWNNFFINKTFSDFAQILRAVRPPGGLTARKISAKSDDILWKEKIS